MKRECETCIKRKTPYCPTSIDCMATDDMPYYQNRIMLLEENQELQKQLEEHKKEKQEWINLLYMFKNQQKEFIKYLEDEKDRLARECSNIYEDSLGHTRLVNEDKFNEVNDILQKYRSIIGENNEIYSRNNVYYS